MAPSLALELPEVSCLASRLEREPQILADAADGIEYSSEEYFRIATIGQACVDAVRFAPLYVTALQEEHGGALTQEQVDCLTIAYQSLTAEDVQAMTSGTLAVDDPERSERAAAVDRSLRTGCGI